MMSVESAIRRVITLHLEAPGTFWTAAMGECFLCLRSQSLSGRWEVMLDNLTRQTAKQIIYHLWVVRPQPMTTIGSERLRPDWTRMSYSGNAPGFEYNGMVLHEYYFGNMTKGGSGDPGKQSAFYKSGCGASNFSERRSS
jgi:hypothetical protein